MKVCFPVERYSDLDSTVFGHFGSAPSFVIVDTETAEVTAITNADQNHTHGTCNPAGALQGHAVDCAVVGGIGRGALTKLRSSGITVYRATALTVKENLSLLGSGLLQQFELDHVCGGNSHGCAH
jgi:predicted Fe-Mo cluster-binding NifX family protein